MLLNIGSVMLLSSPGVGVLYTAEFCPVGALINLHVCWGFFLFQACVLNLHCSNVDLFY